MNRKEFLLKYIDKTSPGLEIGPSHQPLAPKRDGFNVKIIDHASQRDLIKKYNNQLKENIEFVDFIWNGQSYKDLTGKTDFYKWLIASHVIEHTTDIIKFLNDCYEILAPGGILSLAIPDHRYCFDHLRPLTNLAKVIDTHHQKRVTHSPGTIAEYYLSVVNKGGRLAWSRTNTDTINRIHTDKEAILKYNASLNNDREYMDVHSWCFTPNHFKLIINQLRTLSLINFDIKEISNTYGHEFFVILIKQHDE